MRIGVPRERLAGEGRVGLLPNAVRALVDAGHEVWVERDAGSHSGASNEAYRFAGAGIVEEFQQVYQSTDLIVKVKEPQYEEVAFLQENQMLFCFLHLAAHPHLLHELTTKGCMAIAYEGIHGSGDDWPLLAPMSRIAGRLAVRLGSVYLLQQYGGKGLLLGADGGCVVVLGCGVAGRAAIRAAIPLGVKIKALDIKPAILDELLEEFDGRIDVQLSTEVAIAEAMAEADLLIGAVLIPGARAPQVVRRKHLQLMEPGSVIVDIAIDQGGCVETSRPTTYREPIYIEEGVVHCCVKNLPAAVSRTASQALGKASLPYVQRIAMLGRKKVFEDPVLRSAVCVMGGEVLMAS